MHQGALVRAHQIPITVQSCLGKVVPRCPGTSGDVGRIGEHGENEHQILSTHNPEVVGSNPAPATKNMQVIDESRWPVFVLVLRWYCFGTTGHSGRTTQNKCITCGAVVPLGQGRMVPLPPGPPSTDRDTRTRRSSRSGHQDDDGHSEADPIPLVGASPCVGSGLAGTIDK
jgi:hypothetical protein